MKNQILTNEEVKDIIKFACVSNNVSEMYNKITFSWSERFTSRMGDAYYPFSRIRLSKPLFQRAEKQEQVNTVIHETCHLIAYFLFGKNTKPHGKRWQTCMRACGAVPNTRHNVDRSGLNKKYKKAYKVFCECRALECNKRRYENVKKNSNLKCLKCNSLFRVN